MLGRRGVATAGVALAAAVALIAAAPAAAGGVVSHELDGADRGWTAAEIRSAPPRELPRAPAPGGASATEAADQVGAPGSVAGRPPAGALAAGTASFGPFESAPVADPTVYPNSTWGKVFGRIRGVGSFTCSATVVRARNRSVLFTAGHCVKEPGGNWVRQMVFIPAYEFGFRPFGRWEAKKLFVRREWARRGNSNFDYAAVKLRRNRRGRVERLVGSLGLAYNQPRRQTYRAVGYPINKRRGERMWNCVSEFGGADPFYRRPGPAPIGIGCNMLSGASGGGWAIDGDLLASVTSFSYDGRPRELYGPRLRGGAEKLRRKAARS